MKKRNSRRKLLAFLPTPFVLLSILAGAADFEFQDLDPLPVDEMRVQKYSQEFADRFSLSQAGVSEELSTELQALDFLVQKNFRPNADYYAPLIRVYIDSELQIEYPTEHQSGNRFDREMSAHFFSDRNLINWDDSGDAAYFTAPQAGYYLGAFIASSDFSRGQNGIRTSLPINRYEKQILPGLSFLEIAYSNLVLGDIEEVANRDITLWLRKKGLPIPRSANDISPDDYVKLAIPNDFLIEIIPKARASYERYEELINRRRN